jgi:hypothetical protein
MKPLDLRRSDAQSPRTTWETQAARRALQQGSETAEDAIVRALLANTPAALVHAAYICASADLLDHDYLAYWVDELELQDRWRSLT